MRDDDDPSPRTSRIAGWALGTFFSTCLCFGIYWIFVGWAHYSIWSNGMAGQAEMARAEQNRQIRVREAQAHRDAAEHHAQAEIARARGVAESNRIVADGLGGPEGYLRYLYIRTLGDAERNERTIIYVPTDGLLPVTEAGRAVTRQPAPATGPR